MAAGGGPYGEGSFGVGGGYTQGGPPPGGTPLHQPILFGEFERFRDPLGLILPDLDEDDDWEQVN